MGESANQQITNRQIGKTTDERSSSSDLPTTEQVLDLLLDALLERQAARRPRPVPAATPSPAPPPTVEKPPAPESIPPARPIREPEPAEESRTPPSPLPSINLGRSLGRLMLGLVVLLVVINVPINRYGTSLARILPDTASLVIRDGLVLKGSGAEIYVLQDDELRWISSLEAFEFFDYRWEQVHVVDDSFLEKFEKGRPIHVLLKCEGSPHFYALENGQKRWIKDIPTFEAEGYVWEDLKTVSCDYLRGLPDGPPIPEDAGPPPQP
jgi:hypothetical protein